MGLKVDIAKKYYNSKCKPAAINLILKSLSPQPFILLPVAAASKWDKPTCCLSAEWNGREQCLHFITVNTYSWYCAGSSTFWKCLILTCIIYKYTHRPAEVEVPERFPLACRANGCQHSSHSKFTWCRYRLVVLLLVHKHTPGEEGENGSDRAKSVSVGTAKQITILVSVWCSFLLIVLHTHTHTHTHTTYARTRARTHTHTHTPRVRRIVKGQIWILSKQNTTRSVINKNL